MKKATLNLYKNNKLYKKYEDINVITQKGINSLIIDDVKTIIGRDRVVRENAEFRFELDLINKIATYLLKEKNTLFDIEVEEINYDNNKARTIVEYKVSSDQEKTKIELIMNGE